MASEKIISAGVFTNEVDQNQLPNEVDRIGAAIVGPTAKGPAFRPTKVSSFAEYQEIFGNHRTDNYTSFAAEEYLRNGNALTVTRLLPEDGYSMSSGSLRFYSAYQEQVVVDPPALGEIGYVATSEFSLMSNILRPTIGVFHSENGKLFQSSSFTHDPLNTLRGLLIISGNFGRNTDVPVSNVAEWQQWTSRGLRISMSLNPADPDYITKIFGKNPNSTKWPVYVAYEDQRVLDKPTLLSDEALRSSLNLAPSAWISSVTGQFLMSASMGIYTDAKEQYTQSYQAAATPYITSQKVVGNVTTDLFRFVTLSHGNAANYDVKVGIRDIKTSAEVSDPDGYATFTVEVRKVNTKYIADPLYKSEDTDLKPEVIETFRNVNLNPASPKYIAKVIGDQYETLSTSGVVKFNGDFANKSKYIRVEVTDAVRNKTIDKTLIPFGYRALYSPVVTKIGPTLLVRDLLGSFGDPAVAANGIGQFAGASIRDNQLRDGVYHKNNYFGFDYDALNGSNLVYLAPIPSSGSTIGQNQDFYLGNYSQDAQANFPSITSPYSGSIQNALVIGSGSLAANIALSTRKFMVPFQGGFDGARPNLPKLSGQYTINTNTFGFDCSTLTSVGTKLYQKAFDLLSNTDYYDINALFTPGIYEYIHPLVATAARNLCLTRQDTFYVTDIHTYKYNGSEPSIQDIVDTTIDLDNNYTATYWPWVKINNPVTSMPLWVPPSVVVAGTLTQNDTIGKSWTAPAGLNRGILNSVTQTYRILTLQDRDLLYSSRINPIINMNNQGISIWGQKTLQGYPSALDRVNVRRLLITVKKFIASATKYLVFDQNNEVTRTKFLNIVNPYLESVRVNQGLSAFKVVMDNTNNTSDMLDQGILYGQLFLQPTRTAEFIVLDFNIQPAGASFPE